MIPTMGVAGDVAAGTSGGKQTVTFSSGCFYS